jgi:hypothetical protein
MQAFIHDTIIKSFLTSCKPYYVLQIDGRLSDTNAAMSQHAQLTEPNVPRTLAALPGCVQQLLGILEGSESKAVSHFLPRSKTWFSTINFHPPSTNFHHFLFMMGVDMKAKRKHDSTREQYQDKVPT